MAVQLALPKRARVVMAGAAAAAKLANDGHGVARFRCFEQLLESGFSWGRHHFERLFHNKCLTALAPTLFGADEWATYGSDLVLERGWDLLSKMVIGTAPRRFGKSVSLAKVAAALAYALLMHRAGLDFTEYNITVFSTGKRASILLSNYVKKFLAELGLMDKERCEITKQTEERLELRREGLTVIFMFVPANPDTDDDADEEEAIAIDADADGADGGARDALLSFDHVLLFEDCAQDLLMETTTFLKVERRLNASLEPLGKRLMREVRCVDMPLCYDFEARALFAVADFEQRHAPFDVFFAGNVVETDVPLHAAFAEFWNGSLRVKSVALNSPVDDDGGGPQTFPYRTADGNLVRPSVLTLLLKHALCYLDSDALVEPPQGDSEAARWPRTFGVTALFFDFMRGAAGAAAGGSGKARRKTCAEVLARHCSAYYRVPAPLARALLGHLRAQRDPYQAATFKICMDFEPSGDGANPAATLTACYF